MTQVTSDPDRSAPVRAGSNDVVGGRSRGCDVVAAPARERRMRRPPTRPLAPSAVALLRSLPRTQGTPFVFGSPLTAQTRAKGRTDLSILEKPTATAAGRWQPRGDRSGEARMKRRFIRRPLTPLDRLFQLARHPVACIRRCRFHRHAELCSTRRDATSSSFPPL